jgi:pimeloyl-ACP methyl ester carboxylesterase
MQHHLVILPGLDGTATMHADFVAAARPHFAQVTVVSYPSDRACEADELERIARAALPTDATFVLLGESFSGPIAMSIASDPPPGLVGLVLSTTFCKAPVPWLSPVSSMVRFAPVHALPVAVLSWWLLGRWSTAAWRARLAHALAAVDANVLRHRARVAMRIDKSACAASILVPTLCLRASSDRLLHASAHAHLASVVPAMRIVGIDGPHLLLQARPDACASAIASHFASPP